MPSLLPPLDGHTVLTQALIHILEEAGMAVLTLTEGLAPEEFLRSRLTRHEVRRQLLGMARTLAGFDSDTRALFPEIEWAGWQTLARRMDAGGGAEEEAMWFAIGALVPATLLWLRFYRDQQPELFATRL